MAEARGFAVDQLSPELLFSSVKGQSSDQRPSIEGQEKEVSESLTFMFHDGVSSSENEMTRQISEIDFLDSRSEVSGQLSLRFAVSRTVNPVVLSPQINLKIQMNSSWRETIDRKVGSIRPTVWMSSGLTLSPVELSERFTELKEARREGAVLEALRQLDSRVQELYLAFNKFGFNDVRPLIYAHLSDLPKAIPLRMLGGGASRLADMLVSLPIASNGVFLVDEIENGIYHDNLAALWGAVDAGSQSAQSQVFATTHSWECVTAAVDVFRSDPDAFRMFRISRIDGELRVIPCEHEFALVAATNRYEVR